MKYILYFSEFFDANIFALIESVFQNIIVTSKDLMSIDYSQLKVCLLILFIPNNSVVILDKITNILQSNSKPKKLILISSKFCEKISNFALEQSLYYYSIDRPIFELSSILTQLLDSYDSSNRFKDIVLEENSRKVFVKDIEIQLSNMEFGLLKYLVQNSGRAISKLELLEQVWGHRASISTRTVDVHVARLRKKIDSVFDTKYIQTVHCYGYLIA